MQTKGSNSAGAGKRGGGLELFSRNLTYCPRLREKRSLSARREKRDVLKARTLRTGNQGWEPSIKVQRGTADWGHYDLFT